MIYSLYPAKTAFILDCPSFFMTIERVWKEHSIINSFALKEWSFFYLMARIKFAATTEESGIKATVPGTA
jgi:hypothetical protein